MLFEVPVGVPLWACICNVLGSNLEKGHFMVAMLRKQHICVGGYALNSSNSV
jgi:hypothetical protein